MTEEVVERRGSPRYEVVAEASVGSGGEAYVFPVRNISMSGAFVEVSPDKLPQLTLGAEIEILLTATAPSTPNDEVVNVRCVGRVVRIEFEQPPRVSGFGLAIRPVSVQDRSRMSALIVHLAHLPPPRPSTIAF
jgi:hypothetical protein